MQSLHKAVSLFLQIEYLMVLTRRACSWADTKGFLFLAWGPVVLAIVIYFHHQLHFLFLSKTVREESSLSIWSDVVFFSLAYFITFLSFTSAVAAMIASLLLRAHSSKFCLPPLTVFYTYNPTTSFLSWYNGSTFDLGYSPPYMVIIFLVSWSISFTSSLVHSIVSVLYLEQLASPMCLSLGIYALHLILISMLLLTS